MKQKMVMLQPSPCASDSRHVIQRNFLSLISNNMYLAAVYMYNRILKIIRDLIKMIFFALYVSFQVCLGRTLMEEVNLFALATGWKTRPRMQIGVNCLSPQQGCTLLFSILATLTQEPLSTPTFCNSKMVTSASTDQGSGIISVMPGHLGESQKLCWQSLYYKYINKKDFVKVLLPTEWRVPKYQLRG